MTDQTAPKQGAPDLKTLARDLIWPLRDIARSLNIIARELQRRRVAQ